MLHSKLQCVSSLYDCSTNGLLLRGENAKMEPRKLLRKASKMDKTGTAE